MKDLKAHHHLAIVSMLCFGIVGVWAWGGIVFASSSSSTQINVYVGQPDACQNIDGYQTEVPAGMTVDANGNCATPPPPPVDLCDNIDGMQETLPDNYYRDDTGNCYPQPAQANDVCPNLDGTQTSVPDGFVMIEDGRCVSPPKDMCDNIDGVQPLVPDGMVRTTNGICFTPSPSSSGTGSSSGSGSGSSPLYPTDTSPTSPIDMTPIAGIDPIYSPQVDATSTRLKNIPGFLEDVVRPFVDAVPGPVKQTLRQSSPLIARTFPYYVFLVLGAATIILAVQTFMEIRSVARLRKLLSREQAIAEEKDNFIALASHYLRTPLTTMKNSLSVVVGSGQLASEAITQLQEALGVLGDEIEVILTNISHNVTVHVTAPEKDPHDSPSLLVSAFFWVPVVTTIGITMFSNFLLGVVGNVELGTFNLFAQAAVLVTISALFYTAMRTRYIKQRELLRDQALIAHEEALDNARNEFINQSLFALHTKLSVIQGLRPVIEQTQVATHFAEGVERFENMLKKFELLSQIQTGVLGASERFDIQDAVNTIISTHQAELEERQLTIINNVKSSDISQRRSLFDFVLGSLVENAIKFSNIGETIYIESSPHNGTLSLRVSDRGAMINDEKMAHLFDTSMPSKPLEFNYEGLGFSLLLDKIIMDYVGGEISAQSGAQKSTTFNIETSTV